MIRYALMNYMPKRYLRKASFETLVDDSLVWDFKDGKEWATKKAAKMIAQALSTRDLKNVVFLCIPASCQRTYVRRCKKFSEMVCEKCGATDGFSYVNVFGKRQKNHNHYFLQEQLGTDDNYHINEQAIKGKKVILFDDVVTTGKSAAKFKEHLEEMGAEVTLSIFLAKTKNFRRN